MTTDTSPFRLTRAECPVCTTVNDFEQIRPGAYSDGARDTDFCPRRHQWDNPKYQDVNPLLYLTATCSSCHYTRELNRAFQEWKDDAVFCSTRLPAIRRQHLQALADPDSALRRLGGSLWPQQYPVPTAINKLLICILDEQFTDSPSAIDMGRWYLRIAWLFREEFPDSCGPVPPRVRLRRELFASLDRVKDSLRQTVIGISELLQFSQTHAEVLASDPHDVRTPTHCRAEFNRWLEQQSALSLDLDAAIALLAKDSHGLMGTGVKGSEPSERFGQYPSYTVFLKSVHELAGWVPTCESEALRHAFSHHSRAHEQSSGSHTVNISHLQLTYMLGEIARRLGQSPHAEDYLRQSIDIGRRCVEEGGTDRSSTALARHIVGMATQQLTKLDEFLHAKSDVESRDQRSSGGGTGP